MKDSNLENLLKLIEAMPLEDQLTDVEKEFFKTLEYHRLPNPRIYHVYSYKYVEMYRSKELSK